MSQGQGLSEVELCEYIYKYINLKLDKEALIRPNKDVIVEVYTRFVDLLIPNWRSELTEESSPRIYLLTWLKRIFRIYPIDEFTGHDLETPTRKRTNIFLNVLVLFKAEYDAKAEELQSKAVAKAEKKEKKEIQARKLEELRQIREDLTRKIGSSPSLSELRRRHEELESIVARGRENCELYEEKVTQTKAALSEIEKQLRHDSERNQKLQAKIRELEAIRHLGSEMSGYATMKTQLEDHLRALKLQKDLKIKQAQTEVQAKKLRNLSFIQQQGEALEKKKESLEELRKKLSEIPARHKVCEDKVKTVIDKDNKRLEVIKARVEATIRKSENAKLTVLQLNAKKDSLINGPPKSDFNNATYTK